MQVVEDDLVSSSHNAAKRIISACSVRKALSRDVEAKDRLRLLQSSVSALLYLIAHHYRR
jgi:hypothetical protein